MAVFSFIIFHVLFLSALVLVAEMVNSFRNVLKKESKQK